MMCKTNTIYFNQRPFIPGFPAASSASLAPEFELLLCCVCSTIDQVTSDRINALLQQPLNWESLVQLAARHGVTPLLYAALQSLSCQHVPAEFLQQLKALVQANVRQTLLLTQELIQLLKLFEKQDISVLPFKGPILAATIYKDLSLRQITDLDILVHERDVEKVTQLLLKQGYQTCIDVPWEKHLVRAGFYNVDLHLAIAPKHLSYPLQSEEVWQQTTLTQLGGVAVITLQPEMQLLMLCLHGTKERWTSLNRICDVDALVRTQTINWQIVITKAKAQGWQRLIGLGLTLAHELLGTELPEEVQNWLQEQPVLPRLAAQIRQPLFSPAITSINEVNRTLFHMQTREQLQDKLAALWGLMNHSGWFTPTSNDRAFIALPSMLSFLYYFIRPVRVLSKYWQILQGRK